jgi:lysophospholipase L1-like esterase
MPASPTARVIALAASLVAAAGCGPSPSQPTPTPALPQISCPADISRTSPNGGPVTVTYEVPIAVGGAPPVSVVCAPASGSAFAVGATAVTCTATDALARVSACSFAVRVEAPPQLQKTRFMAFGDSMTVGVVSLRARLLLRVPAPTSYPGRLQVLLAERYTAQTVSVDDQGVQGEKAVDGVRRFRTTLQQTRPEVVLLLEGANDLNGGGVDAIERAEAAMDEMVVETLSAGAVPYLASLPPQRFGGYGVYHADAVEPYNDRLRAVAAYRGIRFVDLYAAFGGTASENLIGADGLHPTEAGYQRMAEAFFDAITATLEVPGKAPAMRGSVR